jgi:hypothetical protein
MAFEPAFHWTALFGPIGGPEMIMIFVVLVLLVLPAVLIVVLVKYFQSKSRPPAPPTAQAKLMELNHLRSQNLLSAEEYEAKRKQILDRL